MVALIFKVQDLIEMIHGVLVNLTLAVTVSSVCTLTLAIASAGMTSLVLRLANLYVACLSAIENCLLETIPKRSE